MKPPDRLLLEKTILPGLAADSGIRRILLAGCDRRSAGYPRFFSRKACWTLDRIKTRAAFGGRRHVVGELRDLGNKFSPGGLDLIVLNGLLGFGLDDPGEAEAAYAACWAALRRGGILLLGWNRVPEFRKIFPARRGILGRLRKFTFAPVGASRVSLNYLFWRKNSSGPALRARRWNHTFDFYRKP